MSPEVFFILFLGGIAAGILAGMFGVGGGIVVVPVLISVYSLVNFHSDYNVHIAIATSLFTIIFTSISSSYRHSKNGNVVWGAALVIGISSVAAVFICSKIAISLHGDVMKKIFSAVLILVALKMIFERKSPEPDNEKEIQKKNGKLWYSMTGIFSGSIAAFSGLGGGVFVIPLLRYVHKMSIKESIGTSTAAILITASAGVLSYLLNTPSSAALIGGMKEYSFGMVDTLYALPIILASVPFAQLGAYINKRVRHYLLGKLFAIFILAVSLKLLFF